MDGYLDMDKGQRRIIEDWLTDNDQLKNNIIGIDVNGDTVGLWSYGETREFCCGECRCMRTRVNSEGRHYKEHFDLFQVGQ